jgi:sulfotransferase family protein
MSTNAISQPTRRETGNRSLAAGVTIKALEFLIGIIMFIAGLMDYYKSKLEYRGFTLRPDDVFVVTYPRSGTTWVLMILYQILTDGDMDFTHIHEWSPHYEDMINQRRSMERLPSPRVFKSHLDYESIPKGPCKYIYVVRNGKDVAVSFFHYSKTHTGYNKELGQFFEFFLKGKRSYVSWFEHVGQWWENRHGLNVLFLTYEELTRKREEAIRKIIDFCGSKLEPEQFERVLERSSFAFMKQHEDKFDTITWKLMEGNLKTGCFIRKAQIGQWKECLSNEQVDLFRRMFAERLNNLSPELKETIS